MKVRFANLKIPRTSSIQNPEVPSSGKIRGGHDDSRFPRWAPSDRIMVMCHHARGHVAEVINLVPRAVSYRSPRLRLPSRIKSSLPVKPDLKARKCGNAVTYLTLKYDAVVGKIVTLGTLVRL